MSAQARQLYEFGAFRLDPAQHLLLRERDMVPLTPKLFETLLALVENTGLVVTKDELMSRVWPDTIVEERSLSQNIFLLRKALGEDSKGHVYIETIPKVGYRFLPSVTQAEDQGRALIIEKHDRLRIVSSEEQIIAEFESEAPQAFEKSIARMSRLTATIREPRRSTLVVMASLAVATATMCYLWISAKTSRPEGAVKVKSIAVLPFKPLGADTSDEYLGLGMADTLITRLSGLSQLVVRPTSAIRRYTASEQDAVAAGREQKVEAVLEGSIQRSDDKIRLTVRLVSVRDGAPLWSYKCDERCKDIFAVQDSISERVAEALTLKLTGEERRLLTKHYTENTEAYQVYLKGRFFWNKRTSEGFKKALEYFNQAVEKDKNYALAYAGLADCYLLLADYDWLPPLETSSKARAAATRALEIDDTLAEAHTSLADVTKFYDWDWAGAEREYRRAIDLNPNYMTAHQWYAEFLSGSGRYEEATAEIKRAEELDPLSLVVKSAAAWVLFFAHDYDRAIEQCRKVIEMDPNYGEVYSQLRRAYEQKGMYAEAMAADEKLRAIRRQRAGEKTETRNPAPIASAKAYWKRMLELTKTDLAGDRKAAQFRMAEVLAQLGEKDQAFELLEKAFQERSFWMPYLRVHPHLDPLHSDPRFRDLVRRVGLPD